MAVVPPAPPAPLIRSYLLLAGFVACLIGLIFAAADSALGSGSTADLARLAAGVVLVAEGLLLVLNRWGSRRTLSARLLTFLGRGRIWRWLLDPTLYVLGIAFFAFGVIELVRAGAGAI